MNAEGAARFPAEVARAAEHDPVIGVRAGTGGHDFTPVWAVTVDGRVFIRSWALGEHSWFHAFEQEAVGAAQIGGVEHAVRAAIHNDAETLDAVDDAYRRKYHTPSSARYVAEMTRTASRATTTELIPTED